MVRHSDSWHVRLSDVHMTVRQREYAAKSCKVRLALPDFLVSSAHRTHRKGGMGKAGTFGLEKAGQFSLERAFV